MHVYFYLNKYSISNTIMYMIIMLITIHIWISWTNLFPHILAIFSLHNHGPSRQQNGPTLTGSWICHLSAITVLIALRETGELYKLVYWHTLYIMSGSAQQKLKVKKESYIWNCILVITSWIIDKYTYIYICFMNALMIFSSRFFSFYPDKSYVS